MSCPPRSPFDYPVIIIIITIIIIDMDTCLEWKIVVDQRGFTSGHCTVGGEEEDRKNHGGTK